MYIAKLSFGVVAMSVVVGCTLNREKKNAEDVSIHFPKIEISLDPHRYEDAFSMVAITQLNRGLLRFSPSGDVIPDLADNWTESEDHKTYTFNLKNAKFSDGTPVTAINVQMSFARMFHLGSSMGADIDYIAGVSEFRKTSDIKNLGIRPVNQHQVEFTLSNPSALFLKHLAVADCSIIKVNDFKETWTPEKTAWSGPYRLVNKTDSGFIIEKWRDDKLQSALPPRKVEFIVTEESPLSLAKLNKTDSLDHDSLKPEDEGALIKMGWQKVATELVAETLLVLSPKYYSAEQRKLLASAVDSNELVKKLSLPYVTPAFGLIPKGLPGELHEVDLKKNSPQIGKPFKVDLEFSGENLIQQMIADYLAKKWEPLGVTVNFVRLTKKEHLKRLFGKEYSACIFSKGIDYPDGYSVLLYFRSGYPGNYFHVEDKKLDSLLSELATTLDRNKRESQYREAQRQILAHYTTVPLYFGSNASGLWSPKLKTVPAHPMGMHLLPFETLEMNKND